MGQKQSSTIVEGASKDKKDDLVPLLADSEAGRRSTTIRGVSSTDSLAFMSTMATMSSILSVI